MGKDLGLIPPPTLCDCGRPVSLTLIEVVDTGQKAHRGPYSQYGTLEGRTRRRVLKPGYRFRRWVSRCLQCMSASDG